jgi:hypothetical protein
MTKRAKEATLAVNLTPAVADVPTSPAQRWLGYVTPVVHSVTDAVAATQSVVEKRLGICPAKVLAKAVSEGLDVLGDRLHSVAKRLRIFADGAPQQTDGSAGPETSTPRAQV